MKLTRWQQKVQHLALPTALGRTGEQADASRAQNFWPSPIRYNSALMTGSQMTQQQIAARKRPEPVYSPRVRNNETKQICPCFCASYAGKKFRTMC